MDERNKDLPLIVSEILIEMHEMKEDMREVKTALQQMAALMLKQQQYTDEQFRLLMDENRKNTEMLITAFRDEAAQTRQTLADHAGRISRLENDHETNS
ncbi:hypothetical protein EJV47_26545 [Hymenobacter gummosus]|uniref:Uncharacterized protein n=1 Tax=Hymenobacter gummosus TaxID=1776032 RepID=A0A3S0JCR9_9BACT|nr:hypothetical protein [Hymenobacter gummosus]RTQ44932.1 hypothetical protein EJV47_26545 [Hymenobacter gummosus]